MSVKHNIEDLIEEKKINPKKLSKTNPILQVLIDGVCDENSSLSVFIGTPHIIQTIWTYLTSYWKKLIKEGIELYSYTESTEKPTIKNVAYHGFTYSSDFKFPKPKDLYINMMPFVMERSFEKCKLPGYLQGYWKHIINKGYYVGNRSCKLIPESEYGKIGYLTIHESLVNKNETQRRPGLHTDCPGILTIAPNRNGDYICLGRVNPEEELKASEILEGRLGAGRCREIFKRNVHPWGIGVYRQQFLGGIFMTSNVEDSCEVMNCRVMPDENGEEIIGDLGDVEHLRDFMPEKRETMKANRMYWITDRTPHISLPLKETSYRQYFRLVTSQVSLWFEEHSTKNPLGVEPDPKITKIIKGSKFENNWSLLFD